MEKAGGLLTLHGEHDKRPEESGRDGAPCLRGEKKEAKENLCLSGKAGLVAADRGSVGTVAFWKRKREGLEISRRYGKGGACVARVRGGGETAQKRPLSGIRSVSGERGRVREE